MSASLTTTDATAFPGAGHDKASITAHKNAIGKKWVTKKSAEARQALDQSNISLGRVAEVFKRDKANG
jgi:hypothetical protein